MERDYLPRRHGATYCSPSCGGRCTWAAYEAAVVAASELCRQLGAAWTPRVWENLGWHYSAQRPHLAVHAFEYGGKVRGYTAFLSRVPDSGGGEWTAQAKTPGAAVKAVLRSAREDLDGLVQVLTSATKES